MLKNDIGDIEVTPIKIKYILYIYTIENKVYNKVYAVYIHYICIYTLYTDQSSKIVKSNMIKSNNIIFNFTHL